ncbi:unnamed protein product [Urochloa humidicola]
MVSASRLGCGGSDAAGSELVPSDPTRRSPEPYHRSSNFVVAYWRWFLSSGLASQRREPRGSTRGGGWISSLPLRPLIVSFL